MNLNDSFQLGYGWFRYNWGKLLVGIVFVAGAFMAGRFTSSPEIVEKDKIVVKEVEKLVYQDRIVEKKVYVQVFKDKTKTETKTVSQPDGTTTTTVTEHKDVDTNTSNTETKIEYRDRIVEKLVEKIVEKEKITTNQPNWKVGAGLGLSIPVFLGQEQLGILGLKGAVIHVELERRIIGPFFLGVYGNTQGTAGISLGGVF